MAATDPQIFLTGLVQLLAAYPPGAVEAMLSPFSGLVAKHEFLPALSVVREWLEEYQAPVYRQQRRMSDHRTMLAIAGPPIEYPPRKTFKAQLCETFKIRDVPKGFDTCDLINLRKKFGYDERGFQDRIESLLAETVETS